MKVHHLKTLTEYYQPICSRNKSFELRLNDRDFKLGEELILKEWDGSAYTGAETHAYITYILPGGKYGLDPKYCIMNFKIIDVIKKPKL